MFRECGGIAKGVSVLGGTMWRSVTKINDPSIQPTMWLSPIHPPSNSIPLYRHVIASGIVVFEPLKHSAEVLFADYRVLGSEHSVAGVGEPYKLDYFAATFECYEVLF